MGVLMKARFERPSLTKHNTSEQIPTASRLLMVSVIKSTTAVGIQEVADFSTGGNRLDNKQFE